MSTVALLLGACGGAVADHSSCGPRSSVAKLGRAYPIRVSVARTPDSNGHVKVVLATDFGGSWWHSEDALDPSLAGREIKGTMTLVDPKRVDFTGEGVTIKFVQGFIGGCA